jgi:hypothetical protein
MAAGACGKSMVVDDLDKFTDERNYSCPFTNKHTRKILQLEANYR